MEFVYKTRLKNGTLVARRSNGVWYYHSNTGHWLEIDIAKNADLIQKLEAEYQKSKAEHGRVMQSKAKHGKVRQNKAKCSKTRRNKVFQLTVYLSENEWTMIKERAEKYDRSMSNMAKVLIKHALSKE